MAWILYHRISIYLSQDLRYLTYIHYAGQDQVGAAGAQDVHHPQQEGWDGNHQTQPPQT